MTIEQISDTIQNTSDESARLTALMHLREYTTMHPEDKDAAELLDKYEVLNMDFTKTLKTPAI